MSTTTTIISAPTTTRRPGRALNVTLWVLQVLLAAMFLNSAFLKLSADPMQVEGFTAMGLGAIGMYGVGTAELLGALGLLIPRVRGLAATCLVVLMIGAVTLTAIFVGGALTAVPATVLVFVAVVAYLRRHETAALIALRG